MDIFLSPGDSPLTITPGDTTLHIRVSPCTDAGHQNPPPALPVIAAAADERGSVIPARPRWRRTAMMGLGVLALLGAGLYSRMSSSPASSSTPPPPHLALLAPPEFPSRPVMRPPALSRPQPEAAPAQPGPGPSPLNQAFGLH
ncbi:hypothetical protein OQ496_10680 [Acetobacter suratthaniensis]|uniref:Uncharacterized protein n=1 Tax=Acetobacter suratthaniensis TaxID=1502841 RepID=A0ABS3LNY0_9PROT|nr:hypothetical protein [Acetobacter suratthaniensis]MBO1329060.1 hypothetical protein [Acetobacter suratthaniensis]MCX2566919.1 hypothetical protein [Acetobacter suratthaniensis]